MPLMQESCMWLPVIIPQPGFPNICLRIRENESLGIFRYNFEFFVLKSFQFKMALTFYNAPPFAITQDCSPAAEHRKY